MRTSFIATSMLVLVLVLWMASGLLASRDDSDPAQNGDTSAADSGTNGGSSSDGTTELMKVQATIANQESRAREIVLQGQLEPARVLEVRAEIGSTIETLPITKGQRVKANDIIATLSLNGLDSDMAEANAQVRSARSEQEAAAQLRAEGLQSRVQSERTAAALATATAQRNRIRRDINNTEITAPFDGIVNSMPVELGELVNAGDVIAQLVDDSSFNVTAQVSQQALAELTVGQDIHVELITGQTIPGKLTFVASMADSLTRSFTVEARIDNPGDKVAAGVSASLKIPVETLQSVFLTPSALALGDTGELGVKIVGDDNLVEFVPVDLLSTTIDGAWVSGIPAQSRIITLGQAFVAIGEEVDPVMIKDTAESSEQTGN